MWVAVSFWSLAQGRFEVEKQSCGVGTLSETVGQTSSIDLIQNNLSLQSVASRRGKLNKAKFSILKVLFNPN